MHVPVLVLKVSQPLTKDHQSYLAAQLTALTRELLRKEDRLTVVKIYDQEGGWFVAGETVDNKSPNKGEPLAHLTITVTAGTITYEEKGAWIKAVHDLLISHGIGGSPSYVAIRELPSTDWGYNGVTQAYRSGKHIGIGGVHERH